MLAPGVYPASVTPLGEDGRPDHAALARLLAWFESRGCRGAVVAGTNGEGPSLSAPEKRDLVRAAVQARGGLEIVAGIATPSLDEAAWLCGQSLKAGAAAALVMPPSYFREAALDGVEAWFLSLMDSSELPVLVYNFPQRTGVAIPAESMARLAGHPRFAGLKDSSGERGNLAAYAAALSGKSKLLFVGDETLLWEALQAGWSGTISGAANVVARWLAQIVGELGEDAESAQTKFELAAPVLARLRAHPQPVFYKAMLEQIGVLPSGRVRLPLMAPGAAEARALLSEVEARLGPLA